VIIFTISDYIGCPMDSDYDPEREARAAMNLALAAEGLERQRWIRFVLVWQEIARTRSGRDPHNAAKEAA
jgi:hypothetical protein